MTTTLKVALATASRYIFIRSDLSFLQRSSTAWNLLSMPFLMQTVLSQHMTAISLSSNTVTAHITKPHITTIRDLSTALVLACFLQSVAITFLVCCSFIFSAPTKLLPGKQLVPPASASNSTQEENLRQALRPLTGPPGCLAPCCLSPRDARESVACSPKGWIPETCPPLLQDLWCR